MVERRLIRMLVVPSKTFYFVEGGRQFGMAYEMGKTFEDEINRKPGRGQLKVRLVSCRRHTGT